MFSILTVVVLLKMVWFIVRKNTPMKLLLEKVHHIIILIYLKTMQDLHSVRTLDDHWTICLTIRPALLVLSPCYSILALGLPVIRTGQLQPGPLGPLLEQLVWLGVVLHTERSLVPIQGTCLGRRFNPLSRHIQKSANQCFSHASTFPSLPFSLKSKLKLRNK